MKNIEVCMAILKTDVAVGQKLAGGHPVEIGKGVSTFVLNGDGDELLRKYLRNALAVYAKAKHPEDNDKFIAELTEMNEKVKKGFNWN
jgi:hypothetical protein